jgi:hypothetical protein
MLTRAHDEGEIVDELLASHRERLRSHDRDVLQTNTIVTLVERSGDICLAEEFGVLSVSRRWVVICVDAVKGTE